MRGLSPSFGALINYYSRKVLYPVYALSPWLSGAWPAGTGSSRDVELACTYLEPGGAAKKLALAPKVGEEIFRLQCYNPPVFWLINQRL